MINRPDLQTQNGIIEKYCYDNDTNNCNLYGGLYYWNEMMQYTLTEGAQGICPDGWHIPSDAEWKTLEMELGMSQSQADGYYYRGTDEGKKMKATSMWANGGNGTNSSGFTGYPGGYSEPTTYCCSGAFKNLTILGIWWTSTEKDATNSTERELKHDSYQVGRYDHEKAYGHSVRCVKD
jgi:uncharacterized protein (TIGR02145 family)